MGGLFLVAFTWISSAQIETAISWGFGGKLYLPGTKGFEAVPQSSPWLKPFELLLCLRSLPITPANVAAS